MAYLVTPDFKKFIVVAGFNRISEGQCTINYPDGSVVQVQPGGTIKSAPAGTAGVWELCELDNSMAVYNPAAGEYYAFAYVNGFRDEK